MIGVALDWTSLESFLPSTEDPRSARSCLASSFLAALNSPAGGSTSRKASRFAPICLKATA